MDEDKQAYKSRSAMVSLLVNKEFSSEETCALSARMILRAHKRSDFEYLPFRGSNVAGVVSR